MTRGKRRKAIGNDQVPWLRGRLQHKCVAVGVTGSVAAGLMIPGCILSMRHAIGIDVIPMMSRGARHFVSPYLLELCAGRKVLIDMFSTDVYRIPHIEINLELDAIIVMPATANIIAKLAHGFADDIVTSVVLAATCPVLVVPNMNGTMWENRTVQYNVRALRRAGLHITQPVKGIEVATLTLTHGVMPDLVEILTDLAKIM